MSVRVGDDTQRHRPPHQGVGVDPAPIVPEHQPPLGGVVAQGERELAQLRLIMPLPGGLDAVIHRVLDQVGQRPDHRGDRPGIHQHLGTDQGEAQRLAQPVPQRLRELGQGPQ